MDNEPHQPDPAPRVIAVEPIQRVTSARSSHTEDVGRRMRNYAFSMGIRTLCVVGFVVVFPHWAAWLFVPGAVLLPYVAVILANAGPERTLRQVAPVQPLHLDVQALPPRRDDAA